MQSALSRWGHQVRNLLPVEGGKLRSLTSDGEPMSFVPCRLTSSCGMDVWKADPCPDSSVEGAENEGTDVKFLVGSPDIEGVAPIPVTADP